MKVLITGVSGFIGYALAEKLVSEGFLVTGIDKLPLPSKSLEKNVLFKFIQEDILNMYGNSTTFDVDIIFHLAGQSGVRTSWSDGYRKLVENNLISTQIMLEIAKKNKIKRFFYASSSSVYGNSLNLPTSELSSRCPINPYGLSKKAGEDLCELYSTTFGLQISIFRFFTVYGPRQRNNMFIQILINNTLRNMETEILGDGSQTRDFIYIEDLISALELAASAELPNFQVMNLGSGKTISISDVKEELVGLSHTISKLRLGEKDLSDVTITHANIDLAKSTLKWKPRIEFAEGIKNQWEYSKREFLNIKQE